MAKKIIEIPVVPLDNDLIYRSVGPQTFARTYRSKNSVIVPVDEISLALFNEMFESVHPKGHRELVTSIKNLYDVTSDSYLYGMPLSSIIEFITKSNMLMKDEYIRQIAQLPTPQIVDSIVDSSLDPMSKQNLFDFFRRMKAIGPDLEQYVYPGSKPVIMGMDPKQAKYFDLGPGRAAEVVTTKPIKGELFSGPTDIDITPRRLQHWTPDLGYALKYQTGREKPGLGDAPQPTTEEWRKIRKPETANKFRSWAKSLANKGLKGQELQDVITTFLIQEIMDQNPGTNVERLVGPSIAKNTNWVKADKIIKKLKIKSPLRGLGIALPLLYAMQGDMSEEEIAAAAGQGGAAAILPPLGNNIDDPKLAKLINKRQALSEKTKKTYRDEKEIRRLSKIIDQYIDKALAELPDEDIYQAVKNALNDEKGFITLPDWITKWVNRSEKDKIISRLKKLNVKPTLLERLKGETLPKLKETASKILNTSPNSNDFARIFASEGYTPTTKDLLEAEKLLLSRGKSPRASELDIPELMLAEGERAPSSKESIIERLKDLGPDEVEPKRLPFIQDADVIDMPVQAEARPRQSAAFRQLGNADIYAQGLPPRQVLPKDSILSQILADDRESWIEAAREKIRQMQGPQLVPPLEPPVKVPTATARAAAPRLLAKAATAVPGKVAAPKLLARAALAIGLPSLLEATGGLDIGADPEGREAIESFASMITGGPDPTAGPLTIKEIEAIEGVLGKSVPKMTQTEEEAEEGEQLLEWEALGGGSRAPKIVYETSEPWGPLDMFPAHQERVSPQRLQKYEDYIKGDFRWDAHIKDWVPRDERGGDEFERKTWDNIKRSLGVKAPEAQVELGPIEEMEWEYEPPELDPTAEEPTIEWQPPPKKEGETRLRGIGGEWMGDVK